MAWQAIIGALLGKALGGQGEMNTKTGSIKSPETGSDANISKMQPGAQTDSSALGNIMGMFGGGGDKGGTGPSVGEQALGEQPKLTMSKPLEDNTTGVYGLKKQGWQSWGQKKNPYSLY